jgi:hypothetical protein
MIGPADVLTASLTPAEDGAEAASHRGKVTDDPSDDVGKPEALLVVDMAGTDAGAVECEMKEVAAVDAFVSRELASQGVADPSIRPGKEKLFTSITSSSSSLYDRR